MCIQLCIVSKVEIKLLTFKRMLQFELLMLDILLSMKFTLNP